MRRHLSQIHYGFSVHIEYWMSEMPRCGLICREFDGDLTVNVAFLPKNWLRP